MSTPLIVLASILALFAFVLIPFMMTRDARQQKKDSSAPGNQVGKQQKKKKRR